MDAGYEILKKTELALEIKSYEIQVSLIAQKFQPGQFLMLRIDEMGERIPLTIVSADVNKGSVRIVVQELGKTTKKLGKMNAGDRILDVFGPLGTPSEIEEYGKGILITNVDNKNIVVGNHCRGNAMADILDNGILTELAHNVLA